MGPRSLHIAANHIASLLLRTPDRPQRRVRPTSAYRATINVIEMDLRIFRQV